jgi:hypothetical protein
MSYLFTYSGAETAVGKTFNAFHMAQKEGFRLQVCHDV